VYVCVHISIHTYIYSGPPSLALTRFIISLALTRFLICNSNLDVGLLSRCETWRTSSQPADIWHYEAYVPVASSCNRVALREGIAHAATKKRVISLGVLC
jgi:hypothetical protein